MSLTKFMAASGANSKKNFSRGNWWSHVTNRRIQTVTRRSHQQSRYCRLCYEMSRTIRSSFSQSRDDVICRLGLLDRLMSANGVQFLAEILFHLCEQLAIDDWRTPSYGPQRYVCKRINHTLPSLLASLAHNEVKSGDHRSSQIVFSLCHDPSESINYSSIFLIFDLQPLNCLSSPPPNDSVIINGLLIAQRRLINMLAKFLIFVMHANLHRISTMLFVDR